MDDITVQALANMTGVLQSFLPVVDPLINLSLILLPQKVKPTGLGGFVGTHREPDAALVGRHIQAISEISLISHDGIAGLQLAVVNITQELSTQDRETLRSNGIFKLNFDELSSITHTVSGGNTIDSRSVSFEVDFEYIPVPVISEGVINEFVHNFDLALSSTKARFHQLNFQTLHGADEDPLDYFDMIDDSATAGSSPSGQWVFNAEQHYIEQSNNVRGGPATVSGKKAGAHALLIINNTAYREKHFILRANMASPDSDGIGFVFRKQDDDNFYYLLFSARHEYTLLGKKVKGAYSALSQGGVNESVGHSEEATMEVKLIVNGPRMLVYRNNQFVIEGLDHDIAQAGRLGFLTHRNAAAHFFDVSVVAFDD